MKTPPAVSSLCPYFLFLGLFLYFKTSSKSYTRWVGCYTFELFVITAGRGTTCGRRTEAGTLPTPSDELLSGLEGSDGEKFGKEEDSEYGEGCLVRRQLFLPLSDTPSQPALGRLSGSRERQRKVLGTIWTT